MARAGIQTALYITIKATGRERSDNSTAIRQPHHVVAPEIPRFESRERLQLTRCRVCQLNFTERAASVGSSRGDVLAAGRPCERYAKHFGFRTAIQHLCVSTVGISREHLEFSELRIIRARKHNALPIGRETDSGVDIPNDRLWRPAQHGRSK